MVRLAVQQACAGLAQSDWRTLWNRRRTALHVAALLGGLMVPIAFAVAAPYAARLSAARWLMGSTERWPQETYLTVMGLDARGRLVAPREERFLVEVRTDMPLIESVHDGWKLGGRGEPLEIRRKPDKPTAPEAVRIRERAADRTTRSGMMIEADPVRFRYEFPPSPARRPSTWKGAMIGWDRSPSSGSTAPRSPKHAFGSKSRDRRRRLAHSKARFSTSSSCPTPRSS